MKKRDINKLDREFFLWLKETRKRCERCDGMSSLQPSHVYSRSYMNVRWHPLNVRLLCAKCHWWWTKNPLDTEAWLMTAIGLKNVSVLRNLRALYPNPKNPEMVRKLWEGPMNVRGMNGTD